MSNWQLVFMMLGFVMAIFGAARLNNHQMDKRFDAQIESVKTELRGQDRHSQARFSAVEEDIREIKNDLKRLFQPVSPR